jgi:hypothetical protein
MKKPSSLDSIAIISLNTRIACEGIEFAEPGYRKWCADAGFPVDEWVINYLRLYRKYANPKHHPYIDVPAAERALREA